MYTALRKIELSLQHPQHFIVNSPLIPQPDQCLSFHLQCCQNRITPASLIDHSLRWLLAVPQAAHPAFVDN